LSEIQKGAAWVRWEMCLLTLLSVWSSKYVTSITSSHCLLPFWVDEITGQETKGLVILYQGVVVMVLWWATNTKWHVVSKWNYLCYYYTLIY
jgi:hypothetical protein